MEQRSQHNEQLRYCGFYKVFGATSISRSNLSDLNNIYLFGKIKGTATKETFLNDLLNVLLIVLCLLNGSHSLTT